MLVKYLQAMASGYYLNDTMQCGQIYHLLKVGVTIWSTWLCHLKLHCLQLQKNTQQSNERKNGLLKGLAVGLDAVKTRVHQPLVYVCI